jgi:hypothetical protein
LSFLMCPIKRAYGSVLSQSQRCLF